MRVKCKGCGQMNSYTCGPSDKEGFFVTEHDWDRLGVAGHLNFGWTGDLLSFIAGTARQAYLCSSCGVVTLIGEDK